MKNIVYRLTLITGLLVAPLALSAKTFEDAYLAAYRGRTDMPVPVKIVNPVVSETYVGRTVRVEFTLSTAGIPSNITTQDDVPASLRNTLTAAVAQWRFAAPVRDGKPVASRVILPVRIVDGLDDATVAAAN